MGAIALRVDNLSKQYRIGTLNYRHDTLRDHITYILNSTVGRSQRSDKDKEETTIWALKDVSFEVSQGEVVGVIGRNGAGKSTLLKVLSRITSPTLGRATIYGRVGSLLEVGTGFHPELTGRENIFLNGAILGMKRAEILRKFDEIAAFAELEKFIDTPVKHYSSGMYVRLAFAVAAHLEPEIFIVDEVLAVGDLAFQRKCLGKMQEIAGGGRTVLFVSHNVGAVKSLCSRCIFLQDGSLRADGPPDSVIDCYVDQNAEAIRVQQRSRIEADRGEGFVLHHNGTGGNITIFCGDPLTVEFDIETPKPIPDSKAGIGITLVTQTGDPIVSMSSNVQRVGGGTGVSRFWKVRCDMGRLPINAGTYFARVYVGNDADSGARFNNPITLRVMEYDVFGWGKSLPSTSKWGPMYWAPQWDIRPID